MAKKAKKKKFLAVISNQKVQRRVQENQKFLFQALENLLEFCAEVDFCNDNEYGLTLKQPFWFISRLSLRCFPSLLISYWYFHQFLFSQHKIYQNKWVKCTADAFMSCQMQYSYKIVVIYILIYICTNPQFMLFFATRQ